MALGLSKDSAKLIATFLAGAGLVTENELTRAVTVSNENGDGLLDTMIDFGFVNENEITEAIADAYDLEPVRLSGTAAIEPSTLNLLPLDFIRANRIVPFEEDGGTLRVAISEPDTLAMISTVKVITEKIVEATIIPFGDMDGLLEEIERSGRDEGSTSIGVTDDSQSSEQSSGEVQSSIVVALVDRLIETAIQMRASDIHLESYKTFARARYRLDGVLHDQTNFATQLFERYAGVVTRIKIMTSLNIAERRLPQDGAATIQTGGREIDLRVSVLPTGFGERVVMRILDRSGISLALETLGFLEEDEQKVIEAIDAPQGMVLVTGPTGSGKSTTLYAALGRVNREGINILTAEDPVEYSIDGVSQVQIREEIGLTFTSALRSFLRQDPEVILVGEIRDRETADIAIKSALTGHLVLSTLHTNDAVSTITRLLNMGVPSYLIASSLSLIVAQRLVRKICPECKAIDDQIIDAHILSVGFSAEEASRMQLYKGKGCSECSNTGYKGRQGVYEVLKVTESIREGILDQLTTPQLLRLAKEKENFCTMQDVGRGMLAQGLVTAEEYQRVLALN